MPGYQGNYQYQPRYGFRYLKQPQPAPAVAPPFTINNPPVPQPPQEVAPAAATPEQQHRESDNDRPEPENQVRYASFGDAWETISGGENRRLDQGYEPGMGAASGTSTREKAKLDPFGTFAGATVGKLAGQGIGGVVGNMVLPGIGGFIGGQIGKNVGAGFDAVPEPAAEPTSVPENNTDYGSGHTFGYSSTDAEVDELLAGGDDDVYFGSGASEPVSTNQTARLDDDDSDSGRFGSGTGGMAKSGEMVSNQHDWSAPKEDNDSGGGGGGGGGK